MIEIDGSYGEGGGQIVRSSLALSAITSIPIKIINIRAGREKPGLRPQHLTAVNSVRKVCRGTLEGAEVGSKELVFTPGKIVGGKYSLDIGTAGSTILVAQTIIPILFTADKKSRVKITGGTHVMKSPCYDYFENVFLPAIRLMDAKIESRMIKPGFYPKGGGQVELEIEPSKIKGNSEWPEESEIHSIIRLSNLPLSIAMREKKILLNNGIEDVKIREEKTFSPGNAITVYSGLKGSYSLGKIGKRAETVAQEAVDELKTETGNVDRYLADQLLIYAAMAEGETSFSTSKITEHFKTNSEVIKKFHKRKIETGENSVRVI